MRPKICVCASTVYYPHGGGHFWPFLNWALGFRAAGCEVTWLEGIDAETPPPDIATKVARLRRFLAPYGLDDRVALCSWSDAPLDPAVTTGCVDFRDMAADTDLLFNMTYTIPDHVVRAFRRSALLDIDPGLTQIWISQGQIHVPQHDVYFTIGETVGRPGARYPDCGLAWHYTSPPVFLPAWPVVHSPASSAFTTVTQWWDSYMSYNDEVYSNNKREGFLPYFELPGRTAATLELAVGLGGADDERQLLEQHGWRIRIPEDVASTPADYQQYIQQSRGEFSCAKPSYVKLQTTWISDRTLCYLASGKPAVVERTGPSRFLTGEAGLLRFRDFDEAARCLDVVQSDYDRQCRAARAVAEEFFDAERVATRLLERALD